jgi:hypothetical protein
MTNEEMHRFLGGRAGLLPFTICRLLFNRFLLDKIYISLYFLRLTPKNFAKERR